MDLKYPKYASGGLPFCKKVGPKTFGRKKICFLIQKHWGANPRLGLQAPSALPKTFGS